MARLASLRLLVERRLTAATDDIFRLFARTIAEYEDEVSRARQEIHRQRLLLAAGRPGVAPGEAPEEAPEEAPGEAPGDSPAAINAGGRGLSWLVKPEEGGPSWSEEARDSGGGAWPGPGPEGGAVKQEVEDADMMLEAAVRAEIRSLLRPAGAEELRLSAAEDEPEEAPRVKQEEDDGPGSKEGSPDSGDEGASASGGGLPAGPPLGFRSESSADDSDAEAAATAPGRPGPPAARGLLSCPSCGRFFSSKRTLKKHVRRNASENQAQMSCGLRRPRAVQESPAKSFPCRICGGFFNTQGILVRHAENHCKEPESRCGACGDLLASTQDLREHLRSHKELGCTCDVCGKKCGSIKRMEIHKRVHTGEKPYRCAFCGRDFSRKESLDRHLKVHSGDRPHRCHLCRRTFTRREYLVQHMKTLHCDRLAATPPQGAPSRAAAPQASVTSCQVACHFQVPYL